MLSVVKTVEFCSCNHSMPKVTNYKATSVQPESFPQIRENPPPSSLWYKKSKKKKGGHHNDDLRPHLERRQRCLSVRLPHRQHTRLLPVLITHHNPTEGALASSTFRAPSVQPEPFREMRENPPPSILWYKLYTFLLSKYSDSY